MNLGHYLYLDDLDLCNFIWMNEWIILYGRLLFLQWHLVSRNRLSIFHINTYLLCRKYFRLWGDPKLIEDQHSLFWHFFYWRRLVANNCFFFILHLCSAVYFLFRLKAQANNDFGGKTSTTTSLTSPEVIQNWTTWRGTMC